MKVNLKTTNDENAAATPTCHQMGQRTVNGIIGNTRRGIVIDKTLDPDSNNPVANKPVSTALAALAGQLAKGQVVFLDQLPESGEPHKIYVLTATNQRYWWDGSAFVKIVPTAIKDSTTIKHTLADNKISLDLDETIKEKIDTALQKPAGLTKTKLVGVGTNGQENIEIGDNLTLANGKLSATGGGSGGDAFDEIILSEDYTTYTGTITGTKPVLIKQVNNNAVSLCTTATTNYAENYVTSIDESPLISVQRYNNGKFTPSFVEIQKRTFSHFITLTDNTSTFYLTYQNTSKDKLNTLDSLKTALSGKCLICTGHTDSEIAEYISGEGSNVIVGVVDKSDNSTSGITIDSSFTITDLVKPVE